jgi:hypothetical protein
MSCPSMLLGLGIALLAATGIDAQEQPRPKRAETERSGRLIGKGLEQALNLSAEQKDKLTKLEKEFAAKAQDEGKLQELMRKARQDGDRAAYQKAQEQLNEARTLRAGYVSQVQALLTTEQKKTYDRINAAAPRLPGRGGEASLLAPGLQERLNLSAEQKEKLSELQKAFEAKALQVLTDEQRQRYERLQNVRPRQPQQRQPQQGRE